MTSKKSPNLFSNQRDYGFIAKIERDFFTQLLKYRGHFAGREENLSNIDISLSLPAVTSFVDSKTNDLEILVIFDLQDGLKKFSVDQMYLGTQLNSHKSPSECQVTHYIALKEGKKIKMKLHLDLDFDMAASERKPSPHFQIGGRVQKELTATGIDGDVFWDTKLDKPRWPCLPFCTPLLWHAAFLEFSNCASVQLFVTQPWWKKIVAQTEKTIWTPFIEDMKTAFNREMGIIDALYPGQ